MPVLLNGQEIKKPYYNGEQITNAYYNGALVWKDRMTSIKYENKDFGSASVYGIKYLVLYRLKNNSYAYDPVLYGLDGSLVYETPYTTPWKIFPRYPGARAEPLDNQSDAQHTLGTYQIPVTTFASGMKINYSVALYFNPPLMTTGSYERKFEINSEYNWLLCWVSISPDSTRMCYRGGYDTTIDKFFSLNLLDWGVYSASNPLIIDAINWSNVRVN